MIFLTFAAFAVEQKVNVKVIPADAVVIINGKIVKLNGGRAVLTLPSEIEYSYSVAKEGYEGVDGTFRLKSKSAFNLSIELEREETSLEETDIADITEEHLSEILKAQYDADNYGLMLQLIEKFPENPAALYYLGTMYYYGFGLDKDQAKGVELLKQSAAKDNADANNRLGLIAESGYMAGNANELAAEYYKKGAELGSTLAKYNLALMYLSGSIKRNDKEAFRLFREAAEDGYPGAMAMFGHCIELNYDKDYFKGVSKSERLAEALSWIRKAAENGSSAGYYYLGKAYYYGDLGLASDTIEAYKWFKKGADKGDSDCSYFISRHYKL